jgi:hypothetical protein
MLHCTRSDLHKTRPGYELGYEMIQIPAPSLTDSDKAALISRTVSEK